MLVNIPIQLSYKNTEKEKVNRKKEVVFVAKE